MAVEVVPSGEWLAEHRAASEQGWGYLEFLTAVDWPDTAEIEIIAGLRQPTAGRCGEVRLLTCRVPRDSALLQSIVAVHAGAAWHEREAHEMFGVRFTSDPGRPAPDLRPLLLSEVGQWPLRRTTALPARTDRRWPGLADPGDHPPPGMPVRRRVAPEVPGVPALWRESRSEGQSGMTP